VGWEEDGGGEGKVVSRGRSVECGEEGEGNGRGVGVGEDRRRQWGGVLGRLVGAMDGVGGKGGGRGGRWAMGAGLGKKHPGREGDDVTIAL
jgi:hypothetical protein